MLLSFVSTTFKGILKLGQRYKNIFFVFLVQMKALKFAFEINRPLQFFLGMNQEENAVHCSDLEEDGLLEVEYFFTLMQPYQSV